MGPAPRSHKKLAATAPWPVRFRLVDITLRTYRGKAERRLDDLAAKPAPHPAGRELQALIKAWRATFFVFLEDRRVPATNNESEREVRPSVVFRKVTGGFRSPWGAEIHAGYRSLTSTAARNGQTAFDGIRNIVADALPVRPRTATTPTA